MKSKYVVFLSIMMSLVLIASVIGCGSKSTTSSTTTAPPTTTTAPPTTTTAPPTTTTAPPTSSTTTGTTTKPPTSSTTTTPPNTNLLLKGQTLLTTATNKKVDQMVHTAADIAKGGAENDCVSCHVLGSAGQKNTTYGVLSVVTSTHECDECHTLGYGLTDASTPEWPGMDGHDTIILTNAQIDTSCIICHLPAK